MYNLYERQGGHYMDVGASAKIAKGLVCEYDGSMSIAGYFYCTLLTRISLPDTDQI